MKREDMTPEQRAELDRQNDLVTRWSGLTVHLIKRLGWDKMLRRLGRDEVEAIGNLALVRAARKFKPHFGVRFSTYASRAIINELRVAGNNTLTAVRIPKYMMQFSTQKEGFLDDVDRAFHVKSLDVESASQLLSTRDVPQLEEDEEREKVKKLVETLPAKQRSTVLEVVYGGRKIKQVCSEEGVCKAAVSERLRKAIRNLRRMIS